jgi:hypothetical protein
VSRELQAEIQFEDAGAAVKATLNLRAHRQKAVTRDSQLSGPEDCIHQIRQWLTPPFAQDLQVHQSTTVGLLSVITSTVRTRSQCLLTPAFSFCFSCLCCVIAPALVHQFYKPSPLKLALLRTTNTFSSFLFTNN